MRKPFLALVAITLASASALAGPRAYDVATKLGEPYPFAETDWAHSWPDPGDAAGDAFDSEIMSHDFLAGARYLF